MIDPTWIKCADIKDFYKVSDEFKQSRRRKIRESDIVPNYGINYIVYSYFTGGYYKQVFHSMKNMEYLEQRIKNGEIFFTEQEYEIVKTHRYELHS
jgi:hypothetical protein